MDMKSDVQLINVALEGDMRHVADYPYGLALITAYLRDQNINTLMLQYPVWKKEEYLDEILNNPAYLYGFQVDFTNYDEVVNLVKVIKASNPEAKVIYGGPFVVPFYKELLETDSGVDGIVLGEGEYTAADIVTALKKGDPDWNKVNGLSWLNADGEVVVNPYRPAIKDMDAMPFASRDGIEQGLYDHNGNYVHDVRITTSRGCTAHCTFCAVNLNSKWQHAKRWRGRDPANVVDEIQELYENHNVKLFNLQDSSFSDPGTLGPKRNRKFCEEILKRGLDVSMFAYFQAKAIKDDPESIELYQLYKEAGIDITFIGAEAGSNFELDLYRKGASIEDNYRGFRVLQSLDLFFVHNGFIMFGPYSTLDTVKQNIKFLYDNNLSYHYHNLHVTVILTPGAALYDELKNKGRVLPVKRPWHIPSYQFDDIQVLQMAQHLEQVRTIYPHLDKGDSVLVESENIISRLKNKMNKKIAIACAQEIDVFTQIFKKNQKAMSELAYYGFMEMINRVEKGCTDDEIEKASEPYFGAVWGNCVAEVDRYYQNLVCMIQDKGFGLSGVVFYFTHTSFERKTDILDEMEVIQITAEPQPELIRQIVC